MEHLLKPSHFHPRVFSIKMAKFGYHQLSCQNSQKLIKIVKFCKIRNLNDFLSVVDNQSVALEGLQILVL